MPTLMTHKSSSEKTLEEPNKMSSLLDGTTPEITADLSTTAAFGATIIVTTEKGGTGAATTVMICRGKRPRDNDHEVKTVKRFTGRRDYLEDCNKTLKGPCQLHPKSNHTMEECRVLKSICTQHAVQGDTAKTAGKRDRRNQEDADKD